jgi:hypothetical protein
MKGAPTRQNDNVRRIICCEIALEVALNAKPEMVIDDGARLAPWLGSDQA